MSKLVLALVLAAMMIAGMIPAGLAAETTADGKITINSPIVGAKYKAYKVFDMTMNDAGTSFSYTIKNTSPFYDAVVAYANASDETNADGLTLTATSADPNTFNVSATSSFNAQTFGKALEAKLTGTTPEITATGIDPKYETGKTEVTVAKAEAISFEDLALGYYLILSEYPDPYNYVYLEFGTEGAIGYQKWGEFTKDSTPTDIENAAEEYAAKTYPDLDSAAAYVATHASDFEKTWAQMTETEKNKVWSDLKATTKQSAINLINEKIAGFISDDNAVAITSRLVFIDTTTPTATINEKNETHKWDVPVNPEGHADMPDVPDHGEPEGGKNIVVKEATATTPAIYADWTEANIGDSIHYQLSVNAVNFEQTVASDPSSVKQIKEYILVDYENKNMHFDENYPLTVTIVKKQADGTVDTLVGPTEYTAWKDNFFVNDNHEDNGATSNVLSVGDKGLGISWIEEVTAEQAKTRANVTTTVVDKTDADGNTIYRRAADQTKAAQEQAETQAAIDGGNTTAVLPYIVEDGIYYLKSTTGEKIPETETHYWASKYPNDVTILVDYHMILDDTAVIDGPGNPNYARYGVNYIEPNDKSYTPVDPTKPDDNRKPTSIKEKDDAKVYTYALAIHKVDPDKKDLAGAKFHIMGLTATKKADGYYKVSKYDPKATTYGTEMETDSKGLLVIEGLSTSSEVTIEETVAPDGFNKLEGTVPGTPTKLNETVNTTYSETYYNADGNVVANKEDATTTTTVITTIEALKAIAIEIENKQGAQLPSTGGIGTTIFYIGGSVLVLAAAILLITKRRMSNND